MNIFELIMRKKKHEKWIKKLISCPDIFPASSINEFTFFGMFGSSGNGAVTFLLIIFLVGRRKRENVVNIREILPASFVSVGDKCWREKPRAGCANDRS